MANPSVTYTFNNGTAADASQVNTNFTDLINSLTDGTKNLSISALTTSGAATFNGDINLGDANADTLSITASLGTDLPIKTTGTNFIGSATKALLGIYFGNASNSNTALLKGGVTSASYSITMPLAAPTVSPSVMTFDTSGVASFSGASTAGSISRNRVQNSEFRFWQRQAAASLTSRQNDQYSSDRWNVLTSGGATNISCARVQDNDATYPSYYCGQFRQADVTARRYGIEQIIEGINCIDLRGKVVTMSFVARSVSSTITTLRAGLVEWTGTIDTVTSDIVSSWAATPTLIGSAAFKNTPADLTISATYARFDITMTLGTTFTNLIPFIWTPNTTAQNSDFYIKDVMLVAGGDPVNYSKVQLDYSDDLKICQKYYAKSYDVDTNPGTITNLGAIRCRASGTSQIWPIQFPNQMRATSATVTAYNPVSASVTGSWRDESGTANRTATFNEIGQFNTSINLASTVDGNSTLGHFTVESEL